MTLATHPQMIKVAKSSTIAEIGHHDRDLHIKFKSGHHYVYSGVAESDYHKFLAADSPGTYHHQHIKGKFEHRKV